MSWEAPRDRGEPDAWIGYIVESRRVGERSWFEEGFHAGTSATVRYLENGETYEVRVTAFNKHGDGVTALKRATPETARPTPEPTPQPPANDDNAGNDQGGNQGGGGGGNKAGNQGGGNQDGGGQDQQQEEEAEAEEPEPDRAPGAPRNLRLLPGDRLITVAWSAPADAGKPALSRYELCHRPSGGSWTCWGANGTFSTITGLTNGLSYQVRVTAVGDAGAGPAASGSATPRPQ